MSCELKDYLAPIYTESAIFHRYFRDIVQGNRKQARLNQCRQDCESLGPVEFAGRMVPEINTAPQQERGTEKNQSRLAHKDDLDLQVFIIGCDLILSLLHAAGKDPVLGRENCVHKVIQSPVNLKEHLSGLVYPNAMLTDVIQRRELFVKVSDEGYSCHARHESDHETRLQ